ncbi:MAG: hypothetical protein LBH96_04030 [Candidatus Peribacteria bacterium]|jgi:hypothetical protein|nr:hypothetical protein [Candidatus Peribacteria bacterium]
MYKVLIIGSLQDIEEAKKIKSPLTELIEKIHLENDAAIFSSGGKILGNLISTILLERISSFDVDVCYGYLPPFRALLDNQEDAPRIMEEYRRCLIDQHDLVIAVNGGDSTKKEILIAKDLGIPVEVYHF